MARRCFPSARAGADDDLGYQIVLAPADGDQQERLLAKAASGQLARAIFNAAKSEHPERRIILRKDARVIVDSSSGKMR
jgi:hypothetical protein